MTDVITTPAAPVEDKAAPVTEAATPAPERPPAGGGEAAVTVRRRGGGLGGRVRAVPILAAAAAAVGVSVGIARSRRGRGPDASAPRPAKTPPSSAINVNWGLAIFGTNVIGPGRRGLGFGLRRGRALALLAGRGRRGGGRTGRRRRR